MTSPVLGRVTRVVGNMSGFGVGQTVTFDCYVNATVHVPISIVISKVEFGTDVEDAARVKVTGMTNGSFSEMEMLLAA